jgi:5-methylcytosine-specific restriction endonuclease McrA
MKYYGYTEADSYSELCWYCNKNVWQDNHHIESRGMGGSKHRDQISNLIPLCRRCHSDSSVINKQKDKLKEIVRRRMKNAKTS